MTKPSLSEAQIEKLETIYPKLCSLFRSLEPVVAERFLNELTDIQNTVAEVFSERWDYEEEDDDRAYEELSNMADENNFATTWSITEVKPGDMDKPFSKKAVKSITYESWGDTQVMKFEGKGKKFTWLEAWKYADQLVRQSGDSHHSFIEDFTEVSPGHYALITGS